MRPIFKELLPEARERVDRALDRFLERGNWHPDFQFAAEHTMKGAGKAFRPAITLATCLEHLDRSEINGDELDFVLLSIEMMHTYSLIHDDLPAMDDDDLRRSKPTLHTLKGEAYGILAGDALLTASFESLALGFQRKSQQLAKAIVALAQASGVPGMIAGQWLDMQNNNENDVGFEELRKIHALKTGALIGAASELGALFCLKGEDASSIGAHRKWGTHLGILFQIKDDLLDQDGTSVSLGKTANKDLVQGKDTAATLLSQEEQVGLLEKERRLLDELRPAAFSEDFSNSVADFVLGRDN